LREAIGKITAYAILNTEWTYSHERIIANKLDSSTVYPPALVEKLVDETADDFIKWFSK